MREDGRCLARVVAPLRDRAIGLRSATPIVLRRVDAWGIARAFRGRRRTESASIERNTHTIASRSSPDGT